MTATQATLWPQRHAPQVALGSFGLFVDHRPQRVADATAVGGTDANRTLTEATAAVERLLKS